MKLVLSAGEYAARLAPAPLTYSPPAACTAVGVNRKRPPTWTTARFRSLPLPLRSGHVAPLNTLLL